MEIHHYDPATKEYLSTSVARVDPEEKKPLIPAYATAVELPEIKPGFARCFIDRTWVQKEDHRGEIHYDSRTPKKIMELGPVPANLKLDPDPLSHAEKAAVLRVERNIQLAETDWMMLIDAPLSEEEKDKAVIYRQALRDLPANTPDMENIPWPDLVINKDFRPLRKDR